MLTHRTFKGPQVVPWLLRLDARQIHLRRACWALGSSDNRRVCKRVFGKRHLNHPVYRREYRNSQPPTPGPRSLSVVCLTTLCSRVELCKTAHFRGRWITSSKTGPRIFVSYLRQIPKAIRLKVNTCRALSKPPPPKRLCGKPCVQDPGEASLGSLSARRKQHKAQRHS
jgi:hypothetical protein